MLQDKAKIAFPDPKARAQSAKKALDLYLAEAGLESEATAAAIAELIAGLGHLAREENVAFTPILAHAQAYWLQDILQPKPRKIANSPNPSRVS